MNSSSFSTIYALLAKLKLYKRWFKYWYSVSKFLLSRYFAEVNITVAPYCKEYSRMCF